MLSSLSEQLLKNHHQEHLIESFSFLSPKEVSLINIQLEELFCHLPQNPFSKFQTSSTIKLEPFLYPKNLDSSFSSLAEKCLRNNSATAVLLAGGDGTRLGFSGPKGCFPIYKRPLKTLFHYHCEKISKIENSLGIRLPLIIMTSENNDALTKKFFQAHHYLGLKQDQITFLKQAQFPLTTIEGKWFLNLDKKIATAPNGNGALLDLLKKLNYPSDLEHHFLINNIDNPLPDLYDRDFLGHHIQSKADLSLKVVKKNNPHEKMGALAYEGSKLKIVDYTQHVHLERFPFANINHLILSSSLLNQIDISNLPLYQVIKKNLRYDHNHVTTELIEVYKYEFFITDILSMASHPEVFVCDRKNHFSPLKELKGSSGLLSLKRAIKNFIY